MSNLRGDERHGHCQHLRNLFGVLCRPIARSKDVTPHYPSLCWISAIRPIAGLRYLGLGGQNRQKHDSIFEINKISKADGVNSIKISHGKLTTQDVVLETHNHQLTDWQQDFVNKFVASTSPRNILVAGVGLGRAATSIRAASEKLKAGKAQKVIFLTDRKVLRDQWAHRAKESQINIAQNVLSFINGADNGASITYQSLRNAENLDPLMTQASRGGLLVIADEVDSYQKSAIDLSNKILELNTSNQVLFIARSPLISKPEDWKYDFGKEFILEPKTLLLPSHEILILEHSPSLSILSKLQNQTHAIDDLNWRQFEILISELLESDGYDIELMSGTKDGGVDIIAVKDLGENGMFKALWQAKKYSSSRKIGISTIRELADVRNEHKASKGIIVTSSFLTSGALQRIERDKFILGKVDSNDLKSWIDRKLYG